MRNPLKWFAKVPALFRGPKRKQARFIAYDKAPKIQAGSGPGGSSLIRKFAGRWKPVEAPKEAGAGPREPRPKIRAIPAEHSIFMANFVHGILGFDPKAVKGIELRKAGWDEKMSAAGKLIQKGRRVVPTESRLREVKGRPPLLLKNSVLENKEELIIAAAGNSPIIERNLERENTDEFGRVFFVDSSVFDEPYYSAELERNGFKYAKDSNGDMHLKREGFAGTGTFKGYVLRVYFVPGMRRTVMASAIEQGYVPAG